jgi:16S rRNA U1498 N3-methylase RsmE
MRQTAIEWLENKFKEELVLIQNAEGHHIVIRIEKFDELIQKAKEIGKDEACYFGARSCIMTTKKKEWSLEELYNEIYKS